MQTIELNAEIRSGFGKSAVKKLRRNGRVPANYYIHGENNVSLVLDTVELHKVLSGKHGILDLKVGKKKLKCIIRDIQIQPVTGEFVHVDFMGVRLTEKMVANVPIQLIGLSLKVRDAGARIQQELHELSVECLPVNLPHLIEVDISNMEPDTSILVKDLEVPNVTILTESSLAIALAKMPSRTATGAEEVTAESAADTDKEAAE
jgi:large subunit ribosomal protein L25